MTRCLMSSTSSSQSRHDHVESSSSKTPYEDAPEEGDITGGGEALGEAEDEDLLAGDPLNGSLDEP